MIGFTINGTSQVKLGNGKDNLIKFNVLQRYNYIVTQDEKTHADIINKINQTLSDLVNKTIKLKWDSSHENGGPEISYYNYTKFKDHSCYEVNHTISDLLNATTAPNPNDGKRYYQMPEFIITLEDGK